MQLLLCCEKKINDLYLKSKEVKWYTKIFTSKYDIAQKSDFWIKLCKPVQLMQLNQWTLHCVMPFYPQQHIFKYLLLQISMAKWCKKKSHTFLKSVYVLKTNAKNRQMIWNTDYVSDIYLDWPLQQITEYFVITLSNHTNRIRYFRKIKIDKHIIQHCTFALPNMFVLACLSNNGETRVLDVTECS
jgi:hypothetical protein